MGEVGQTAILLQIQRALLSEQYLLAWQLIQKAAPLVRGEQYVDELMLYQISVHESQGEYAGALELLNMLHDRQNQRNEGEIYGDYSVIEHSLLEGMSKQTAKTAHQVALLETTSTRRPHESVAPKAFEIEAAYPNPFNPRTVIPFSLPGTAHVSIYAYDITGRRVSVLADRQYVRGRHTVIFDGSGLSSGTYFIRAHVESAESGTQDFVESVTLLK